MKRNWNSAMRGILFLLVIIIVSLFFAPIIKKIEGFSGLYVTTSPGNYPKSVNVPLLDDYPLIGKNETSYNNYSDDWKSNQSSSLASYKQTTNNYKFFNNPDNGLCTGAEFCGALYKNKEITSNIIKSLPPTQEGSGARVGYFRSEPNKLYFSIPTNENILY